MVEVSRWHLKISFKISNRNQSPVGICCRHHNKPPHPHPKKKKGKKGEKKGGKKKRKKFVAEFFAWKVSQFKEKKEFMRFGDWSSFCPYIDFGCFLAVWVNKQFACSIGSSSFLPSFQGFVIFIKDLLTHIEFDCFDWKKKRPELLNLKQSSSKDSLVESSQVLLTPPGSNPIELLLESQVFSGCTPHLFFAYESFIIIMSWWYESSVGLVWTCYGLFSWSWYCILLGKFLIPESSSLSSMD